MEERRKLQPISIESQRRLPLRRVPNIHRNSIEDTMAELVQHIVEMWNGQTGLPFEERRQLTVRICKMLLATLG